MANDEELRKKLEREEREKAELAWRQRQAEQERIQREQAEERQRINEEKQRIEKGGGTDSTRP